MAITITTFERCIGDCIVNIRHEKFGNMQKEMKLSWNSHSKIQIKMIHNTKWMVAFKLSTIEYQPVQYHIGSSWTRVNHFLGWNNTQKNVISISAPKQSQIATKLIAGSPKSQLSRVLTGTSEDGCSSFCNCGDFSVPTTVAGLSIVDVITGLWKSDV